MAGGCLKAFVTVESSEVKTKIFSNRRKMLRKQKKATDRNWNK